MKRTDQREQGEESSKSSGPVVSSDSNTLRTSQNDQARGYLESLADNDFMAELQSALEQAQRLTKQTWTLTISSDAIEIHCAEDSKRIKLPKPKPKLLDDGARG
jgi:hypothetical protein